jgi:hypothetical protein
MERFNHTIRKDETKVTKKIFENEPENGKKWEEPYWHHWEMQRMIYEI